MYLNIKNIEAECAMCGNYRPCNECVFGYICSQNTEHVLNAVLDGNKNTYISEDIFKIIDLIDPWFPRDKPDHIPKTINIKNLLKYWCPTRKLGKVKRLKEYLDNDQYLQFCEIQPTAFIKRMQDSINEDKRRRRFM